jgi:gluconokinase
MIFTPNPADERRLAAPSCGGDRHGGFGMRKSTIGALLASRVRWEYEDVGWLRPVANVDKMRSGVSLTDEDRRLWLKAVAAWIDQGRCSGRRGAVACTALKRRYRDVLDRQSCRRSFGLSQAR